MLNTRKPSVLVVDDMPDNLSLISSLLLDDYHVRVTTCGEKALSLIEQHTPDLVLLDVMMPGMDGYEVCSRIRSNPCSRDVPVLFLTAQHEVDDERSGLAFGANDYLHKPIVPPILLARLATQLRLKQAKDQLHEQNDRLDREVRARTRELEATHDVTILALASLAETRDNETGNHLLRTQHYVRTLAEHLRDHPRFAAQLSPAAIERLFKSAPLHDIGKVGIPDRILLKPGRLEPAEYDVMKRHPELGYRALANAEALLGQSIPFLETAKQIVLCHHERWDGTGYPQGLAGEAIPLGARLMAVADVYDAIISRRVYKPEMPHAKAVDVIREGSGTHFDPDVVVAFLAEEDLFRDIARRFADTEESLQAKRDYHSLATAVEA